MDPAERIAALEAALAPFAAWAAAFEGHFPDDDAEYSGEPLWLDGDSVDEGNTCREGVPTVGDLRRAAAVLPNSARAS